MPREPFWTPYELHREVVDRLDAELEAATAVEFAMQAETWFSKEGVRDCV
jgi:hypothetical protein